MQNDKIKLAVLQPEELSDSLSVSGSHAESSFSQRGAGAASTQSQQAILTSNGLRIIPTKSVVGTQLSVHDVAAFILQQQGEMTAMKLQKLVYYSQAWSLVWDEEPLFSKPIEAWANGPVVRELYSRHQGQFKVREWSGDAQKLTEFQRDTVIKVLEFYGSMSSQALSDLTHQEGPWRQAREGLSPTERGSRVIELSAMAEYYSSL